MTSVDGSKPMNLTCTAGTTYYKGYLYKVTSNAMVIVDEDGSATIGVCDQSTVDAEQTARAAVASEKIGFFLLGSGAVVYVASKASQTYETGCRVVNSDDVDGMCADTADSAGDNLVGIYVGDGETTSATDGDLVPLLLCFGPESVDG